MIKYIVYTDTGLMSKLINIYTEEEYNDFGGSIELICALINIFYTFCSFLYNSA